MRVFEWNGTMLHAKTAVADRRWSRVGSTNLNLASWMSNYELDVAIEDATFAEQMAGQYEADLARSTEIVLTRRNRVRRVPEAEAADRAARHASRRAASGSAGRAAAGAFSVGSALGAALTGRRILGPAEAGLLFMMAGVAIGIGVLAAMWPRALAWPVAFIAMWSGIAWVAKGISLRRRKPSGPRVEQLEDSLPGKVAPPAPESPREDEAAAADAKAARDRGTGKAPAPEARSRDLKEAAVGCAWAMLPLA